MINLNEVNKPPEKRIKQRNFVDKLIERPVEMLISLNVSPNILSLIGFLLILSASMLIFFGFIHKNLLLAWIPPFLVFMAGAFDIFDGEVARRTNQDGSVGAFLDSNVDRISDAVIILGLIYSNLMGYISGLIILFLSLMISYTRSRAEALSVNMKGIGLMERAERLILTIVGLTIEVWIYRISIWILGSPITIFQFFFIPIYILLLAFTVGQRFYYTYKVLNNKNEEI